MRIMQDRRPRIFIEQLGGGNLVFMKIENGDYVEDLEKAFEIAEDYLEKRTNKNVDYKSPKRDAVRDSENIGSGAVSKSVNKQK